MPPKPSLPKPSLHVLIIEDEAADTKKATVVFHKLGLKVQSKITIWSARDLLEKIAQGDHPVPHLIVLDLGFLNESGFAILRYWKSTPVLAKIPVIVWTQAGELDREIAGFFGVSVVVQKAHGLEALEKELKRVIADLT